MNMNSEARDYGRSGALAEEIPYWGWLPDGQTCLTRAGELLTAGRLAPMGIDGRRPEQLDRVLDRWQRLLSGIGPHTRLYFYLLRRPSRLNEIRHHGSDVSKLSQHQRRLFLASRVREMQTFLVWCHDPQLRSGLDRDAGWMSYARSWLARRGGTPESAYLYSAIQAAADRFRQMVQAHRALVDDLTPIELLTPQAGSRLLSELINRPGIPWDGATGSGLNWRLALSELEAERRHLRLDGEPAILYSLLSPPGEASANLLNDLYCLDATLTVSLEWRPLELDQARKRILSARRHYFAKRYSLAAHMQEKEGTDTAMVDSAAEVESERLGEALVELEADGIAYGEMALCIALHGDLEEIERLDGDVRRIFSSHDAKVIREGYGQLPAWFCRWPAQPSKRQVRTLFGSAGLAACLAPIFGPPVGYSTSGHLQRPALAVMETRWNTPYHYDLFDGDVGHTLVLGSTGSGKSFLLNFLLVSALQYDPRVLILDLGGSYRWLTAFLGGSYLEMAPSGELNPEFQLRPFSLPPTERTCQFLTGWMVRLLRLGGWTVEGDDTNEIRSRIQDLYLFSPERRTLSALVRALPSKMWPAMSRWHGDGAWASYFDHSAAAADLDLKDWQVIDLAGAAEHEDLCEAALFYLLERLRLELEDPADIARVKLMIVDEAWRYLRDPSVVAYLAESAKTWRKRNAALVMATQSAVDITGTAGAEPLLESMPTKIFLANPDLPSQAGQAFRLNERELELVRELVPKRELYLRRPNSTGVLRLNVDPKSYWLYTSSPPDAEKRGEFIERYGLEQGIERLSKGVAG